jgi:hypothetical protein
MYENLSYNHDENLILVLVFQIGSICTHKLQRTFVNVDHYLWLTKLFEVEVSKTIKKYILVLSDKQFSYRKHSL